MAVQKVDDDGNLWFLSAKDSHKNEELNNDPLYICYFRAHIMKHIIGITNMEVQ